MVLALCAAPFAYSQASAGHADSTFMKDAAQGGMDEVKLGQLAQQNAANDRVKKFGQQMVADHTRMGNELQALAAQKNVALPNDISLKQKASNRLLSAKSGDAFDRSYISDMVKDHRDDIAAFEKEANSGGDADVKSFAMKALPTLREHLQMVEDIARELGISE